MSKKKLRERRKTPEPKIEKEFGLYRKKDFSAPKPPKGSLTLKEFEDSKVQFDPHITLKKSDPEKNTFKGMRIGKKGVELFISKKFNKGSFVAIGCGKVMKDRKKKTKIY